MKKNVQISATIVLYKEDTKTLQKTVDSFLNTNISKQLFLVDNSPTNILKEHFNHPEITYVFNDNNVGFGTAHNQVLNKIDSSFHLILNPDVVFTPQVIPNLIEELVKKDIVSMISPRVEYPNGELQYTCRKHPTIIEMISRRLGVFKKMVQKHQYQNKDLSKPFYPQFIHGCFFLFKTTDFIKLNGFDKHYFLYLEDADICRKIEQIGKKILYYPQEKITHIHRKGSSKNMKLLYHHFISAIKYFKKWSVKS